MIFTTITCTECGEPSEVAGSLALPFVCSSCWEAKAFQEKIAPTTAPQEVEPEYITGDPGDEDEHEGCGCAANVEATTELIADLEAQVAALNDALDQTGKLANDAVEANTQLTIENAKLQSTIAGLQQIVGSLVYERVKQEAGRV